MLRFYDRQALQQGNSFSWRDRDGHHTGIIKQSKWKRTKLEYLIVKEKNYVYQLYFKYDWRYNAVQLRSIIRLSR